ncbi:Ligand-binding domain of nuclear hormone receptor [Dictyocaulus viviparus]|uniref:Ligand-binding domain of nuclear hormone receptor n=1 Tax=Dictyocaulus viviparus TaxID=29172 RepID=A0A0D8XAV4_DICVI|nr:Ligand-binding domain of nuclear hormone receptor [Dictyocaulus viviparus]
MLGVSLKRKPIALYNALFLRPIRVNESHVGAYVQWNRDVLSTTVHKKKFESTPNTFVRKSVPRKDAVTRMVFDMSPIMAKLKSIMSDFKPDGCLPREPLQRMYHALLNHRKTQLSGSQLQIMESLSLNQLLEIWKAQLFAIGEWMMHCEEFARLPLDEKLKMFKNSWMIWQRFERITMSIELFGWRAVNEKLLAISDDKAIVIDTVKFDFSSLTDHDPSYIRRIFEPFADRLTEEVTKSCLEVGLNIIEVVYVLCTLMWHVEGRFVNSETQAVAETYRERMSDNLHYYYTTILKAPNYAGRLIRLMTIVHCIENIHYERSKIMELARIFDIFKVEVSENGMFDC